MGKDWYLKIEAKDYVEAYNKAYSAYGPQVEDMMYYMIN